MKTVTVSSSFLSKGNKGYVSIFYVVAVIFGYEENHLMRVKRIRTYQSVGEFYKLPGVVCNNSGVNKNSIQFNP